MACLNCGHSVSIFIPGITEERDLSWKQDYSEQYKLRQDANYAKRQTKQWERRAELAKANGDQMAYKTAKNKAKEYRQKQKEIAQKRAELDKKQREARFSQPRGKAFPLDSSSLKSQKNNKEDRLTQQAKDTAKAKEKASKPSKVTTNKTNNKNKSDKGYQKAPFNYLGKSIHSWKPDSAVSLMHEWTEAIAKGYEDSRQGFRRWFDEHADKTLKKITSNDILNSIRRDTGIEEGIHHYTTSAYKTINGILRGLIDPDKVTKSRQLKEIQDAYKTIKELDKFFDSYGKLDNDALLYRALNFKGIFGNDQNAINKFASNPEAFIGMTWTDKGYTSTSPSFSGISAFVDEADAVLHIYAKKGTSGAYISPFSEYRTEYECLLDRHTTFRLVDYHKDEKGKLHLMVEVL